jgi:hypothetical protein
VRYTPAATLQFPYLKLHQFVYRYSGGLIGFADRRWWPGLAPDDHRAKKR